MTESFSWNKQASFSLFNKTNHSFAQRNGLKSDLDLTQFTPIPRFLNPNYVKGGSMMNDKNRNLAEITKHITRERSERHRGSRLSKPASLKSQFISGGLLCKDCRRYMARAHYSVCKKCYEKRVQKLLKNGGVYVLTPKIYKQLERELRV